MDTIKSVRIGRPYNDISEADPNDLMNVSIDDNEILQEIVKAGYNGTFTLKSGEKFRVSVSREKGNRILLIQTKLHTKYDRSRGTATLIDVNSRYVEITFGKPLPAPATSGPSFNDNDFPALGLTKKKPIK